MRRLIPLFALTFAGVAYAQIAPTPDSPGMGGQATPTSRPTDTPVPPDSGIPSDVHTAPPPVTTQAPPPTAGDTAPVEAKAKGRAKPASTAKAPPRG